MAAWFFAGYVVLNTLGNLASKSQLERLVMTPISLVLAACLVLVASSPWKPADSPDDYETT